LAKRSGVGATLAAAVVFSVILASNFAVFYAAQDDARLHALADAADTLADNAAAAEGAEAANILLSEQAFLGSHVFSCSGSSTEVSIEIADLRGTLSSANLEVDAVASTASWGPETDNLSMLVPFQGFHAGSLNTAIHYTISGGVNALAVFYHKNETHYVNLPVGISELAEVCNRSMDDIRGAVSSAQLAICTESAVSSFVAQATAGDSSDAKEMGFDFSVSAAVDNQWSCSFTVRVLIAQDNISGLAGNFSLQMQEGALLVFGGEVSPPQG